MKTQKTALAYYQLIKIALNEKLTQQGYAPVHEEAKDAVYGSCSMLWSNNIEALRFEWNGKEQWFCLEITEDLPLKPLTHWDEILMVHFDKAGAENQTDYVSMFLSSLK